MREPHNAGCLPIRFNIGGLPIVQCDDPTLAEQPLFGRARRGEAVAQLWQAPQGFVVPGSYRKFANLAAVSDALPPAAGRCGCVAPAVGWCRRGRGSST